MLNENKCQKCGRELTHDEIALYKKLISKVATKYMCIDCLAEYFEVSTTLLEEKIDQYKKLGCTLFK